MTRARKLSGFSQSMRLDRLMPEYKKRFKFRMSQSLHLISRHRLIAEIMLTTIFRALHSWAIGKPATYESHSPPQSTDPLSGPERAISVIHSNPNGPSTVINHHLDHNTGDRQFVPGATGYSFVNLNEKNDEDENIRKRVKKSMYSLEKLCKLLQEPSRPKASNSQETPKENIPIATVEKQSFISSPQLSDEQKDLDMTDVYSKLSMRFDNSLTSTQFFNSHCSTIKSTHLNASNPIQFQRIDINTGICLYSKSLLLTSPGSGQSIDFHEQFEVPPLPKNEKPTIYELEIIMRLSSAIADVVALIGRPHTMKETPISINIDIPDFQYYWTAFEFLQHNLVSIEFVQHWMRKINERRRRLHNILVSVIRSMLRDRQLPAVPITLTTGTEAAVTLVEKSVALGIVPTLEQILTVLKTDGNDASRWREFLYNLDERLQPSTVGDLSRLIYIFKAVKPVLKSEPEKLFDKVDGENLLIQVDDVNEWRILDNGKKFLKRYTRQALEIQREPLAVGLFPIQKIFVSGSGRTDLYIDDPSFDLYLGPEKKPIDPFHVIGTTYGPSMGGYLRRLCRQEGFRI